MTSLDLALIGNGTIGALVDPLGEVVWACFPRFDGDPAFCSLLRERTREGDFGFLAVELVDFAKENGATLLIRGLRAVSDFEYEFQMALMNRHLAPSTETVFMVPSLDTTYISSSIVREVAFHGGEVDDLLHPEVARALKAKIAAVGKATR